MNEDLLDWRTKGFWQPEPVRTADFLAGRPGLFDGGFTWPVLVAGRSALEHNLRTLAGFCAAHGLAFAPHAKTHLAPLLLDAQRAAGAWGVTAATANQVLALRRLGASRVILASQLLDRGVLRWMAAEAGFEVLFQVDSVEGVRAAAGLALPVLVELGHPGGRTGCRTLGELRAVAAAVAADPALRLAGVAGYEGGLPDAGAVTGFLDGLRKAVHALAADGLLGPEVIVATGGSAWFDLVAARLGEGAGGSWPPGHRVTTVLRSGAYVSHDEGFYRERTPFNRLDGELRPALTLWAQVLSTPEPGLAILGAGKRDVSYDEGLPVPRAVRSSAGGQRPEHTLSVTKVNDHHLYLADPRAVLRPGDLVGLGISHPCTAFDKWRAIPVLDDDGTVTDVLWTYF
jgi:D-serine deaminase-like pyridoxal phosphate-dependent protein